MRLRSTNDIKLKWRFQYYRTVTCPVCKEEMEFLTGQPRVMNSLDGVFICPHCNTQLAHVKGRVYCWSEWQRKEQKKYKKVSTSAKGLWISIDKLIRRRKIIEPIKLYMRRRNVSFSDAKHAIDDRKKTLKL